MLINISIYAYQVNWWCEKYQMTKTYVAPGQPKLH